LIRTTIFPPLAKYILSIEAVRKKFFILISQIGITYRAGSLSMHGTGENGGDAEFEVKAGDRLPYFEIDGQSIYEHLHAPKFHLLTFSNGDEARTTTGPTERERDIEQNEVGSYTHLIDRHVIQLYPEVAKIFGTEKPFSVLLRPDNYLGFISADNSWRPLSKYFARLFNGD
jgi:hypothetical protein